MATFYMHELIGYDKIKQAMIDVISLEPNSKTDKSSEHKKNKNIFLCGCSGVGKSYLARASESVSKSRSFYRLSSLNLFSNMVDHEK